MKEVFNILNNKLTFNFQSAKIVKEVTLDKLPPETIAVLLDYGTRKLNDTVNSLFSKETNTKSREELVEEVWNKALEGTLGERRAHTSPDKPFKDFIFSTLRNGGLQAKVLKSLTGLTPEKIIETVWDKESPEYREKVMAELKRRFEESQKLMNLGGITLKK